MFAMDSPMMVGVINELGCRRLGLCGAKSAVAPSTAAPSMRRSSMPIRKKLSATASHGVVTCSCCWAAYRYNPAEVFKGLGPFRRIGNISTLRPGGVEPKAQRFRFADRQIETIAGLKDLRRVVDSLEQSTQIDIAPDGSPIFARHRRPCNLRTECSLAMMIRSNA